jgi:hypothetical protein
MFISRGIIKLSIIYHPQNLEFRAGTLTRALTTAARVRVRYGVVLSVALVLLTTLEFPVWT